METKIKETPSSLRVERVCKGVRQLARTKGPGAKLPTVREFTQMFNVGHSTVTDALSKLEVENVVQCRDRSGIYVSPRIHHKTIAIVISSRLISVDASPFWGSLLGAFSLYAEQHGLAANQDFEIYVTSPSPEPHAVLPEVVKRCVREGSVNGVVALGLTIDSAKWLIDQGVPCSAYAGWSKWIVTTDSGPFIQAGLQVLADQGCKRIEYWGLPRDDDFNPKWYEQTRQFVEAAYTAVGIEPPQTLVGPAAGLMPESAFPRGQEPAPFRGYMAIKALYEDPARPKPDGIFVGDDTMASGVLLGLLELGVRVGEDIKIAAQANRTSPILFGTQPNITLLEYDPAEIAGALIQLLNQAMENPDLPETEICLPWQTRFPV